MSTDNNPPRLSSSLAEIIRISQILGLYDDDNSTNNQKSS